MLMPAAVLVFLVLGALCVDVGLVFLAEREMSNAAAAAANDAVSKAIDVDYFYETGNIRLRPETAREVATRSVAAKGLDRFDAVVTEVVVDQARQSVLVRVRGRSQHLFARAVPNGPEGADVEASAEAVAEERLPHREPPFFGELRHSRLTAR